MNWKKIYASAELIFYCLRINLCVLLGILMGGVLLGIGPGIQAGFHLAKLDIRKQGVPVLRTYLSYYKANFWRSNRIFGPILLIFGLPTIMVQLFVVTDLTIKGLVLYIISQCILITVVMTMFAMYEFYEIPAKRYFGFSLKFLTYQPVGSLLGLLWFGICSTVTLLLPGLLPFVSIGIWIYGTMGLYLKFFEENEQKVAAAAAEETSEMEEATNGIEMVKR